MGDIYGRSKRNLTIIWKVGVVILGFILVVLGIFHIINDTDSGKDRIEVMGTVTKIEKTVLNGNTQTNIYVQYNADGIQYTSKIDNYDEEVKDKQVIKVFYNKNNPTEVSTTKEGKMTGYVLLIIGLVILVVWFLLNNLLLVNVNSVKLQ